MTTLEDDQTPGSSRNNQGTLRIQPVCRDEQLVAQVAAAEPVYGEAYLWWLTQASWLLKTSEATFVIDPWWRDVFAGDHWAKLLGEYPLHPSNFPSLDHVLCSHWHDDHLCPETIPRIAAAQAQTDFVIPSRSVDVVEGWGVESSRIIPAHGHGPLDLGNLRLWCVPAAHEELDFDQTGASWYVGYVIESGGVTIYHMGDGQPWPGWHSAIGKANQRLAPDTSLDIALLCINGNDNLHHGQAVDLIEKVAPRCAIPMHYGMDPGNTVDPQIFVDEMTSRLPDKQHLVADVGQCIRYSDGVLEVLNDS
jgi:L-ascorbate metabolism protein UlaG (beta-lactamase superfamily)